MERTFQALPNEQWLIEQSKDEPKAFAAIYDHYFPRIYTYIRYRVDNNQTADDLTAFVFERALSRLNQYQSGRAPLSAWLFGIARNAVSNHRRRKKRWQWLPLTFADNRPDHEQQPEAAMIQDETEERLLAAVSQLPYRERDLIALRFVSGLNNRQIAALTDLTESNVGVILHRALKKLRADLKEVNND